MERIALDTYYIQVGTVQESLTNFFQERQYSRIAVLVDEHTEVHCLPLINDYLPDEPYIVRILSGEQHKSIATCQQIWRRMMDAGLDRKALLINLGGGVIGDMGGFCARTFKRGMAFLQIPTTLLSQVDASIGGKLGIDFGQVKNSIGLFHNPEAVLIDPAFLQTLPDRELRSGFAEVLKHALIQDRDQWEQLRLIDQLTETDWEAVIPASLRIKRSIVAEDPYEQGLRKALNFGHTIGHAVESLALDGKAPLLHGEAIAIGMICEAWLSSQTRSFPREELQQLTDYLLHTFSNPVLPEASPEDYLRLMRQDKKNEGQQINFSLLSALGQVQINQSVHEEAIIESLQYYHAL